MQNVSTDIRNAFNGWLVSTYDGSFKYATGEIIRVRKDENFDYLFCQRQYHDPGLKRGSNLEYVGFYCKPDRTLYDVQYTIRELVDGESQNPKTLREALKQAVRCAVEKRIRNNRRNLQITELSTERKIERLEYCMNYEAPGEARKAYLDGDVYTATFRCGYTSDTWTEDSLLAYILDPEQYVAGEVEAYISNHQEDMLFNFKYMDAVTKMYSVIVGNPQNPIHKVKRIMAAVSASSAKTVTVTIHMNDTEFTFKAEARQFCLDCTSDYSKWNILAADRREFERLFGRCGSYGPEHITRIEYARKVLYQA